jgi:16S rRNA (cytidine1402-2'-O)-methyltransferase
MLYIVSTPIGNLEDVTLRALDTLRNVYIIAAEDTRHTKILLNRYSIKTPLTSYFEYNKITKGEYIIRLLREGKSVALVSDSGTPGISDPGAHIIKLAIKNNIPLTAIPGPSAFVYALTVSGKPTDKFAFEGFLPSKSSSRKNRLKELTGEKRTIVLYESPHRILKTLQDIHEIFGDIEIAVLRELTKVFEEQRRERVLSAIEHFKTTKPKGEFVIVI